MKIKKLAAVTLALIMSAAVLTSCDKKKNDSSSDTKDSSASQSQSESSSDSQADPNAVPQAKLVIDGKEIDTSDLIICTVDGIDVDFDTFRYYYYYSINMLTQTYGATLDTIKETEGGFDTLLENTITYIKQEYVTYRLAEDNGVELTEDDIAANESIYNNNLETSGSEEEFNNVLKSSYMTPELYRNMLDLATLYEKCEETLFTNEGVYATKKEDFREIVKNPEEYACIRSILIPYQCKADITNEDTLAAYDGYSLDEKLSAKQLAYASLDDDGKEKAKAAAKELAESVAEKAANGDDFEDLIKEYNWDPGMESFPDGYYITPNTSYVQEYLDCAFSLAEGETSTLIENDSYGWFILKRMPVDMDYVEENIETMIQDYDLPSREQLYQDTMDKMEVSYSDIYKKLTVDSIS